MKWEYFISQSISIGASQFPGNSKVSPFILVYLKYQGKCIHIWDEGIGKA